MSETNIANLNQKSFHDTQDENCDVFPLNGGDYVFSPEGDKKVNVMGKDGMHGEATLVAELGLSLHKYEPASRVLILDIGEANAPEYAVIESTQGEVVFDLAKSAELSADNPLVRVGRAAGSEITIDESKADVSRAHAEVSLDEQGRIKLEDLSTNNTMAKIYHSENGLEDETIERPQQAIASAEARSESGEIPDEVIEELTERVKDQLQIIERTSKPDQEKVDFVFDVIDNGTRVLIEQIHTRRAMVDEFGPSVDTFMKGAYNLAFAHGEQGLVSSVEKFKSESTTTNLESVLARVNSALVTMPSEMSLAASDMAFGVMGMLRTYSAEAKHRPVDTKYAHDKLSIITSSLEKIS